MFKFLRIAVAMFLSLSNLEYSELVALVGSSLCKLKCCCSISVNC